MKHLTTDTFFNGCLKVNQNRFGYRFSIDAVLLAYHVKPKPDDKILDLGTGCGIVALILAYRNPAIKIYGIELQKELAQIAALNVRENCMTGQISILCDDLRRFKLDMISGPVDLVTSNPPYRKAISGRINPNQQRAIARHEIKATLFDILESAKRLLRKSGRFITIYPSERTTDLLTQMRHAGIEPKYLRIIHSGFQTEAKLILVEGIKGGHPGMKIDSPLIIYNKDGSYTDAAEKIFLP